MSNTVAQQIYIDSVDEPHDSAILIIGKLEETNQEPVAWSLVFTESYGVNADTTYKTEQAARDYAISCGTPSHIVPHPKMPVVVPLYTHPQPKPTDNEILKEAHRICKVYKHKGDEPYAFDDGCMIYFARKIIEAYEVQP
ncbi:MAG: hypothetical protein R8M45_05025 [Ghiorsea sp.]